MWTLLSLFIKVLPDALVKYIAKKEDTKVSLAGIAAKEEIKKRELQAQIVLRENDHWIAWLPRFTMGMVTAAYYAQVLVSSMLQRPDWGPLKLPADFIPIIGLIIGAYFIVQVTGKVIGAIKS